MLRFASVAAPVILRMSKSDSPLSLREVIDLEFTEDPSLIGEGLLPNNGIMLIGGAPKSYKSFLLGEIALNLATGSNLFAAHKTEHGRTYPRFMVKKPVTVLLVEQEIGWYDLQLRYRKRYNSLEVPKQSPASRNLFFASCDRSLRLDTDEGMGRFCQVIESCHPDVLALDPLVEFHGADENSTQEMSAVFRNLDRLRERYKLACIICHHTRKAQKGEAGGNPESLRGAQYTFGKGDSFLMAQVVNRSAGVIQIVPTIRRGVPIHAFRVKLDWETLSVGFHDWKKGEEKE